MDNSSTIRSYKVVLPVFLALILLIAAALHFHGIVQMLPYHLDADEPNVWLFVNHLMTTGRLMNYYPPGRVVTLALSFRVLDWITPGAPTQAAQFLMGRVGTVWLTMLLLALIYQTGRWLVNRAAGIAALLFLMVQPNMVYFGKMLRTDGIGWIFGMLSVLLTILTVRTNRRWLIVPAFLTGGLAVLGKYTMLPVLLVPLLALMLAVPRRWQVRALLVVLAAAAIIVGFLVIMNPPEALGSFLTSFHGRQLYERESFFQFVSFWRAWPALLEQFGLANYWFVLLGLPFAALIWPRYPLTLQQWLMIGSLLAAMVSTYVLLGFFRTNRPQDRYLILLGFTLLWGGTLGMLMKGRVTWTGAAAAIVLLPWFVQGWQLGTELRLPDTRIMTVEWFLANTPSGTHIALEKDTSEFLPYGGYQGDKIYFTEEINSVYERSVEEFARSGVEYLVADFRNVQRGGYFDRDLDNSEFLSQVETELTLLEPWAKGWQGPERYIFHVPPLQDVPMHVFLGDAIIFKGYDLPSRHAAPGETLDLVLYWSALRETDANYTVFTHLYAEDGTLATQLDGLPGDPLHRTYDWWAGYFDWDDWPLTIPAETVPGTYTLVVGMYDSGTGLRLPATDADGTLLGDTIPLGEIEVVSNTDD